MDGISEPQIESTTYHTPHGDIVVPTPPDQLIATRESNLAPLWLIFPKFIVNTSKILGIHITKGPLTILMEDGTEFIIPVNDTETTWKALQTVFADGVARKA